MKIICFGDSLTRGISFVNGRLRIIKGTYPALLASQFERDTVVLNKGVFNDDSDKLIKRLEKDVLKEQPDYVFLNIGGNDCNFYWEEVAKNPHVSHHAIVPLKKYEDNIKELITGIHQSKSIPIVITLPPIDPIRYYRFLSTKYGEEISHWICCCGGIGYWHSLYNDTIIKLAKEWNVQVIDIREALVSQNSQGIDYFSEDGIHLNRSGYEVMSTYIFQQFQQMQETN